MLLKGTVMQIEMITDKWSLLCFKSILKILHSNFLRVSIVFYVYKENFTTQKLKN